MVREVVAMVDRDQPLDRISSMEAIIDGTLRQSRFHTVLPGLFACVALTLAVVGIYGVVAWNVAQRTREVGIRQALGASRRDVVRLVVGQAMRQSCSAGKLLRRFWGGTQATARAPGRSGVPRAGIVT
jgi:putative ABC transport system permease protein